MNFLKKICYLLLLISFNVAASNSTSPLNVETIETQNNGWGISINGTENKDGALIDLVDKELQNGRLKYGSNPTFFSLNSSGGVFRDAFLIAKYIQSNNINTYVYDKNECSSSCVLMLMAGKKRWISSGATIGIHQFFVSKKADNFTIEHEIYKIQKAHLQLARIGQINPFLLEIMSAIPPDDIKLLKLVCSTSLNLDNQQEKPYGTFLDNCKN